jgi:DNA-binding transcriptional ArsR family regulator
MTNNIDNEFGGIMSLIGEKSRAKMLWSLLDGKAYTATELAVRADITRQACSNHLQKLLIANLLKVVKSGRHKYYSLSNDKVARVIENLAYLIPSKQNSNNDNETGGIRYARTCYDHLAGKLACNLTRALIDKKIISYINGNFSITKFGIEWFGKLGIDISEIKRLKRKFVYPCLDWSERKNHIGGSLGAIILKFFLQKDWIRKSKHSREIFITGLGKAELSNVFNIDT